MLRPLALALMLVLPLSVHAQQPKAPSPQQMEAVTQMLRQVMLPFFKEMMQALMETQFEALSERKNARALATYTRNFYEELVEAGFSEQDAMTIATNTAIPVMPISMGQR